MNIINEDFKRLEKMLSELSEQKFFYFYNSIWHILFVSLLKGLASGLGFVKSAVIASKTFLIVNIGDQSFFNILIHISPDFEIFGWYIGVSNFTIGGLKG